MFSITKTDLSKINSIETGDLQAQAEYQKTRPVPLSRQKWDSLPDKYKTVVASIEILADQFKILAGWQIAAGCATSKVQSDNSLDLHVHRKCPQWFYCRYVASSTPNSTMPSLLYYRLGNAFIVILSTCLQSHSVSANGKLKDLHRKLKYT